MLADATIEIQAPGRREKRVLTMNIPVALFNLVLGSTRLNAQGIIEFRLLDHVDL